MSSTVYVGASGIYDNADATALAVRDGVIVFIGTDADAQHAVGGEAIEIDLQGGYVIPGVVEAHTHLLLLGQSLSKASLHGLSGHAAIRSALQAHDAANPGGTRLTASGWLAQPGDPTPHRELLDDWFPDTPVFIDSNDLHEAWVNTAALLEMGINEDTPDPADGELVRDGNGRLTGLLRDGAAIKFAWSHLTRVATDEERQEALRVAFEKYLETGVTTAVDMALSEPELTTFLAYRDAHGSLPIRVRAHWLIPLEGTPEKTLHHVRRAGELSRQDPDGSFAIIGVKIMVDGVLDSCTAALRDPFTNGEQVPPMWSEDQLVSVIEEAEKYGLQVAMHAIGDVASDIALNALEHVARARPDAPRRHRLEHLEVVDADNFERLARLKIVASMQPAHADPAIGDHAIALLGPERAAHVCAWATFEKTGAVLAFGTDAPTAAHDVLPSIYIATTRRSATDPQRPAFHPELAVTLHSAIAHSTSDAAYAARLEHILGALRPGLVADFAVLDVDPFAVTLDKLLENQVRITVVAGAIVFPSESESRSAVATPART